MIGLEDLVVTEGVIAQWLCTWLPLYALLTDIVKIWVLVIFYIYFYILLIKKILILLICQVSAFSVLARK